MCIIGTRSSRVSGRVVVEVSGGYKTMVMQAILTPLLTLLQVVAISGGTVHPMDGGPAYVGTVVVVDGVIESCGVEVLVPDGAVEINAEGLHVVPGLIDGMIHHDGEHDDLYVRAGVLMGRDLGNDLGRILIARARRGRSDARGPRLWVCGSVLDGVPPVTTKAVVVRSEEEARSKLQRLLELQVDFIATHSGVPEDALRGAVQTAHAAGLAVWGPVPRGLRLGEVVELGMDGVVGLDGFLADPFGWVAQEQPDFSGGVAIVLEAGCAVMPVLNAVAARISIPEDPDGVLALMGPHYGAQWRGELAARERLGGPSYYERGALALSRQRELLADLFGAGVPLLPGSGAPNPWVIPGDGLHEEFKEWVEAGIPPGEVLRASTRGAAQLMGVEDRLGAIAEGLLGDLLVIEGDPRKDLEGLRRPRWVVLRGEALSAEVLEERVVELRQRQAAARLAAEEELVVEAPELPDGELVLSGRVESEAYGERVAVERYAVVKLAGGETSYCSRTVVPATATEGESQIEFQQTISGRLVSSFDFVLRSQGSKIEVRGRRVGGQLRVERRVDGLFLDNSSTSEAVGVVDPGSVTAAMVVAHHMSEGKFKALYFEDLEPAVVVWEFQVKEGGVHTLKTGEGPLVAIFRDDGGLDRMERTRGNTVLRQFAVETDAHGGPGMPLPLRVEEPVEAVDDGAEAGGAGGG